MKQHTGGRGADYVFEAAGSADGFRLGAEIVRPGGHLVFLGKVNVNQDVAFRWGALMGEKKITRSSYGGARPAARLPLAGALLPRRQAQARRADHRPAAAFRASTRASTPCAAAKASARVVLPWDSALTLIDPPDRTIHP